MGNCVVCGDELIYKAKRDQKRKKFCSHKCKGIWGFQQPRKDRSCKTCSNEFQPSNNAQIYCSEVCIPKREYSTEHQYLRFTNPRTYFVALLAQPARKELSLEDCFELLEEQEGKCALTGIELTFKRIKGIKHKTNASLDRIVPGGPYIKSNVRLVCAIVNKMRLDMSDEELKFWCSKILSPEGGQ
jgi:hypothetical protein